ncbi:hypothetical protein ACM61V_13100 [Sphingomonas sp. TX0543]|uniref:hypothetical protein n=1 Tax=unclassified Sphingomonas TaxID=196159 RepID=UPI0010F8023C|nr:hypothetical protein [Sphingomonas sp. 3P27F8]
MNLFDRRIALLLTQLAFAVLLVNELVQLSSANDKLSAMIAQQGNNDAVVARINTQLDGLARGTQQLAQHGNPQAAKIVAQLAQNGVRIDAKANGR